jgi:hypothetical protein
MKAARLDIGGSMAKKRPLLSDAYEEWLKLQPVTPATKVEKRRVEADTYEEWLMEKVEKKRSRRI